ncbi:DUF6177 family protein [Clavibacter tessellarius]|nr:DUF6177 family protein [Clavibacter michiganensis]
MSSDQALALPHPLVDDMGPGWVRTETDALRVGASSGRLDLLTYALRNRSTLILVTRPSARLTVPLFQLLQATGSEWRTRDDDGTLRRALTGVAVDRPVADGLEEIPRRRERGTPDRPGPWPSGQQADAPLGAWLQFAVATHHPARAETMLGRGLQELVNEIDPDTTISWGTSEPTTLAWDRRVLTRTARERMPRGSRFFAAGHGASAFRATITVTRTALGVTEETSVVFAVAEEVAGSDAAARHALSRVARRQRLLVGSAWTLRGGTDCTVTAGREVVPDPVAAAVGPHVVRMLDLEGAGADRVPGAVKVGRLRAEALLVGFGQDEDRWRSFAEAIRGVGISEATNALFGQEPDRTPPQETAEAHRAS